MLRREKLLERKADFERTPPPAHVHSRLSQGSHLSTLERKLQARLERMPAAAVCWLSHHRSTGRCDLSSYTVPTRNV